MRSITLSAFEHQTLSVGDGFDADLSAAEAARLISISQQRRGFCTPGYGSLKLAQYVGLVNLGGRVLEVLPKVGAAEDAAECRGTLLRLLRLAHDLPLFSQGNVDHDLRRHDLLDVFVGAFLESLIRIVRAGLLRRYRAEEEDLGVVRGRLQLHRQIAVHGMRIDRIACRFDEFTADNPWNQVLKSALSVVRPWTRSTVTRRHWLEMSAAFDEVALARDPLLQLGSLRLDRQSSYYETATHWAGWILKLLAPNLRAGRGEAPELLFDMNRLFESAVATQIKRRSRPLGLQVDVQNHGRHLATFQSTPTVPFFGLIPDVVVRDNGKTVSVVDTKWSLIHHDRLGRLVPPDHHVYQLNAYASAFDCEELVLLYPWHQGLQAAQPTVFHLPEVRGRHPRLHVACIDVSRNELPVFSSNDLALKQVLG